jgi:hypothetical protein
MREPWEVFALVLTITLGIALIVAIVFIGADIAALTRADGGSVEVERWQAGIRGETVAGPGTSNSTDVARGEDTDSGGAESAAQQTGPLAAMVLFAGIPIFGYAAGLVSFARRRRWPYVIMTGIQVALLLAVAVPALFTLFR